MQQGSAARNTETIPTSNLPAIEVYGGLDGFAPKLTPQLLAAINDGVLRSNARTRAATEPIVRGFTLHLLDDDLNARSLVFRLGFPGFFDLDRQSTPAFVSLESKLRDMPVEDPFRYRRIGGMQLPSGATSS